MRLLFLAGSCLAVLAACGGGGGSGAEGGDTPTPAAVDYFPLAVGNRWVYQGSGGEASIDVRGTRTVDGRNVFVVRYLDSSATEDLVEKTGAGVFYVATPGASALDNMLAGVPMLRLPPVAGQTEVPVDRDLPDTGDLDGDGVADRISVRVVTTTVGFETVGTPAGSFADSLHVRTTVTQTIALSRDGRRVVSTITSDDWYAPGVGPVRSVVSSSGDQGTQQETLNLRAWRAGGRGSETVAPTVESTAPAAGSVVSGLADLAVTFSEPMFQPSLNEGGFVLLGPDGAAVPGLVTTHTTDTSRRRFLFLAGVPLVSGTLHRACHVAGAGPGGQRRGRARQLELHARRVRPARRLRQPGRRRQRRGAGQRHPHQLRRAARPGQRARRLPPA